MPVSMDRRGRALDNVFIERLWRSLKYYELNIFPNQNVMEIEYGLEGCFAFYNHERPHQSLAYRTPADVYHDAQAIRL